jgi:dTDP-4-amino-4,6-dideoxygalactose transaminase
VSEKACEEVLALPIYAELTEDQQAHVVSTIKEFFARH